MESPLQPPIQLHFSHSAVFTLKKMNNDIEMLEIDEEPKKFSVLETYGEYLNKKTYQPTRLIYQE